jgi:hypothetical protein
MSGASGTLDPIEAARADIAQSRDLIASVEDDLHLNQRWFDSYRISERRHARRLKRLELLYRLQLGWEQFARLSKRTGLSAARDVRDAYRFLLRNAVAARAWTAPRLHAIGVWLTRQARRLGVTLHRVGKDAGAWTARTAPIVWRRTVAVASASIAWSHAKLQEFLRWLSGVLSFAAEWLRVEFDAAALATGSAASKTGAWSVRKGRRSAIHTVKLSRQAKVMAADVAQIARQSSAAFVERAATYVDASRERWTRWQPARVTSRALVVRRSTALVCVAPPQSNLPVLRAAPAAAPRSTAKPKPKAARKARAKTKTKSKSKPRAKRKSAPRRRSSKT